MTSSSSRSTHAADCSCTATTQANLDFGRKSRANSELHIEQPKTDRINAFIMVVRIRLARFGKRNAPFYNIVVAQAR